MENGKQIEYLASLKNILKDNNGIMKQEIESMVYLVNDLFEHVIENISRSNSMQ